MTDQRLARNKPVTRTVDCNHPCAGRTLHFEVQAQIMREAAPAEIRQVSGQGH